MDIMFKHVSKKIRKEILSDPKKRLNLGSGQLILPGEWVKLDYDDLYKPDIQHDLTKLPWPFEDNTFDVVFCSHVIEHLPDHRPFLNEIHRITKPGGILVLMFPHYSRSWFSNQHARAYGIGVLRGFLHKFEVINTRLKYTWWQWNHWYKIPAYLAITIIEFFANLSPWFFERVWCYWFGGFDQVIIEARIKKDEHTKTAAVPRVDKVE